MIAKPRTIKAAIERTKQHIASRDQWITLARASVDNMPTGERAYLADEQRRLNAMQRLLEATA